MTKIDPITRRFLYDVASAHENCDHYALFAQRLVLQERGLYGVATEEEIEKFDRALEIAEAAA